MLPKDTQRARRIVRTAVGLVKNKAAKAWLLEDTYGKWELHVCELLESTKPKVLELGLTEAQADTEIAAYIGYAALSALLENAKKHQQK